MESLPQDLGGAVRGAVVHHDDLIELVVQGQQGADRGLDGNLFVVGGHQDGHGDVVVVPQLVFQQVAPLGGVEVRGPHRHRQEEKAGVAHHVEDEEGLHAQEEKLDKISHTPTATSSGTDWDRSWAAWASQRFASSW